jgi:TonB family protein
MPPIEGVIQPFNSSPVPRALECDPSCIRTGFHNRLYEGNDDTAKPPAANHPEPPCRSLRFRAAVLTVPRAASSATQRTASPHGAAVTRHKSPFTSHALHSALPLPAEHGIITTYMQFQSIQNAIDLLGPAPPPPPEHQSPDWRPSDQQLTGKVEPKLDIAWGAFHQGFCSSVAALFGPWASKDALKSSPFRDSWVEGRVPKRAVIAAALWHIAILALPISLFKAMPHRDPLLQNMQVAWKGPIDDLPLLEIAREKPKEAPAPKPKPVEPLPTLGADAFHPRQRIFTDPVHPTHPRQTLINPKAPPVPPKLLPNLPNIVLFEQVAGPAKPRLEISEEMIKKARPNEKRQATTTAAPPVDIPNMQQQVAEMNLPAEQSGPARPKLELNAGAAPRVAQKTQSGSAVSAPDVGATQLTAANGGPNALIALSANPAPPAPVPPPQGNLAARVSISPDGKQPAAPANSGNGAGKSSVGISISGGNPSANAAGAGTRMSAPVRKLMTRPEPKAESEDVAERTGPPDFASLPPGAKPETVFAYKKVYTLNVNMPNLNSATGSWILNFSELHSDTAIRRYTQQNVELSGPVPVQKVDPQYPPTLITERVSGEVILYAVIRRDGTVDSIQLVRGIDQQLDANAIKALRQWKFRPGAKQGTPVELEAIVHIPFRLPEYP